MRRVMAGAADALTGFAVVVCALLVFAVLVASVGSPVARADEGTPDMFGAASARRSGPDSARGVVRSSTTRPGITAQQGAGGSGAAGVAGGPEDRASGSVRGIPLVDWREPVVPTFTPYARAGVSPQVVAREAAADLRLPVQAVRVGPDPSLNQWGMVAVGYPVWLWREGPVTSRESVSLSGASLLMVASYESTSYDMGDGQVVRCAVSTPWVKGAQPPGTPSPTCGYVYEEPGQYTIRATHTWGLVWSGMGASGSFPLTNTSSTTLKVGELASVIIER